MQRWTALSDNDFRKYSWAHVGMSIMVAWRFLKTIPPEGVDSHAHSEAVSALGLYTLRFPLNLWIFSQYELWIICNLALRNIVSEQTDISLTKFGTKVVNHDPSLLAKTKHLVESPFCQNQGVEMDTTLVLYSVALQDELKPEKQRQVQKSDRSQKSF